MTRWTRWLLPLVIALILLLQAAMLFDADKASSSLRMQDGLLDATGWSFAQDGIIRLDGVWRFYPNELADPLALPENRSVTIAVPGQWSDRSSGQGDRGSGTYEATVLLPSDAPDILGLKVTNIRMAHRLFVDGKLVYERGEPAVAAAEHRPGNTPYVVYVSHQQNQLHLVIQVSNFKYYEGGIAQSILLGDVADISRQALISFGVGLSGFMMTASFGLYTLLVFLMRERERMYLHAGLFFFGVSLNVACSDEKVLMVLLDWLPFGLAYKLQDISSCGSLLLLLAFFRTVEPKFVSAPLFRFAAAPVLLYIALAAALPYEWYVLGKMFISPYEILLCLLAIVRWLQLLLRRGKRPHRLQNALMLGTALFVTGSLVFHYLYLEQVLQSRLLSIVSYFAFIFTINLFLAWCSTDTMRRTEQLSQQLWRANLVKSDFLQRTSHELKTPLQGIRNLADHVSHHAAELPEEQRRQLELIASTAGRLSYLVNDLVDATQLRNAAVNVYAVDVDLSAVTEHVIRIVSFQLDGKPLKLINLVPKWTTVEADEARLQQIVYNLVINAVKYSSAGDIVLAAEKAGDFVKLTVTDQGIGIAEREWESVFEDNYRSDDPGRPLTEGMGLGLFISRGLAQRLGGKLYVSASAIGQGTTMTLELRRAPDSPAVSAVSHAPEEARPERNGRMAAGQGANVSAWTETAAAQAMASGNDMTAAGANVREMSGGETGMSPATGERKTILLVDDDPANIEVLRLILKPHYELEIAHSASEALALIDRRRVDLMIADLIMPGVSGIELTARVRQRLSALSLPIVIATASASESNMQLAYMAGANDYVAKPFIAEEIRKRVQLLLQLSAMMETALRHERAFLAAQIKPHFLYNAINNIVAICYEEPERAAELLLLLSRHLRRLFQQESTAHTVSLKQELDLVRAYVEIERLRFGKRLRYREELDPALLPEQQQVTTLLIQPLVENAIAHGLFNKEGGGVVVVRVAGESDSLRIEVEDDGIGMEQAAVDRLLAGAGEAERGVGLSNVRRRIASVPGASFELHSAPGAGTLCVIKLPLK